MPTVTQARPTTVARSAPATHAEVLFSDDMGAFKRTYRAARSSVQGGTNPLNAFKAAAGRAPITVNPGIAFGIEFEFEGSISFDPDDLASALYSEGLTESAYQRGYHSGDGRVLTTHQRGWRYEEDGSVSGGEIVSPKMTDNSETWMAIENIVGKVTSFGGHANSRSAGQHIHLDTALLGRDVDSWRRLYRMVHIFEDTLFRLAANPFRSRAHRNNGYVHTPACPNLDNMYSLADFNSHYNSHTTLLNTYGVGSNGNGHVEFRIWDATLDPAIIQTQVKISVALINAALNPATDALLEGLEMQPRGTARKAKIEAAVAAGMDAAEARRTAPNAADSGADWEERTKHIRAFVDVLFPDSVSDKEQVITLFAMNNKWPYKSSRR